MKTLQEQCAEYVADTFPAEDAPLWKGEVQQAFYAGALSILTQTVRMPDLGRKVEINAYVRWLDEAAALCAARKAELLAVRKPGR